MRRAAASRLMKTGGNMFSHIMIGANDIDASKKFYDAVLGALNISPGTLDTRVRTH